MPPRAEAGLATGGTIWFYFDDTFMGVEMDLVVAAGAKWVRYDARWDTIEPTTKGVYDWTQMDRIFDAADARGLQHIVTIQTVPTWANDGTPGHPPTHASDYGDVCAAIVDRYKNRGSGCRHWEIWNEANLGEFWGGQRPDPAFYVPMLQAACVAIKATDPTAVVIAGGLLKLSTNMTNHVSPVDFINGMYQHGARGYFDALSFHPYTDHQIDPDDGGVTPPENNGWNDFGNIRTALAAGGDAHMPIWITEYGNYTAPATDPDPGVTEAQQATWMTHGFNLARGLPNIAYVGIFNYRNPTDGASDKDSNYGIYTAARVAKAALAAFQTAASTVSAPTLSVAPIASGMPVADSTVHATRGLWLQLPSTFSYQWQDSANGTTAWSDIPGATSADYSIDSARIGRYLSCRVAAANEAGVSSASRSSVLGPVLTSASHQLRLAGQFGLGGEEDIAALTTQRINRAGAVITPMSASVDGDGMPCGRWMMLRVANGGASPVTVTLNVPADTFDPDAVNPQVAVAAGAAKWIGPLDRPTFADPETGLLSITYSGVNSVAVAAVELSQP